MAATERIRLHITPFNSELLDRYLPSSIKAQATGISFHTVETFPERGFGYMELPTMEAQKLKKKLNGSVLKGAKVKIEEAKPEKKRKSSEDVEEVDEDRRARKKARKEKRKKDHGVIPGHELESGRVVKRGWDEKSFGKKSKKGDTSLEDKKLRFKTVVPPNKTEIDAKGKKSKSKKDKKGENSKKGIVVKEFANTTKTANTTTPLSDSNSRKTVAYEDGVGWVDETGKVVEEEPPQKKLNRKHREDGKYREDGKQQRESVTKRQSPSPVNELPESESDEADEIEPDTPEAAAEAANVDPESDSDSNTNVEQSDTAGDTDDADELVERQLEEAQSNLASNAAVEREKSNSVPIADAVASAELDNASTTNKDVHPLEALFKRPAPNGDDTLNVKRPAPIDTSFSFFESTAEDDQEPSDANPPQTPHTKQDLEWRSIRSAAPTPDTAAIGRRFNFPFTGDDIGEDAQGEDAQSEDANECVVYGGVEKSTDSKHGETEFRKWFYENRGDLNRSWKKRRREEKKIMRQRENRRLSRRIA